MTKVWQELDLFNHGGWTCAQDEAHYKKLVDKERIYDFLVGLNKDLHEIRGRAISMKPILDILEIFAEVRREESRKRAMLGDQKNPSAIENSTLVVRGQESSTLVV